MGKGQERQRRAVHHKEGGCWLEESFAKSLRPDENTAPPLSLRVNPEHSRGLLDWTSQDFVHTVSFFPALDDSSLDAAATKLYCSIPDAPWLTRSCTNEANICWKSFKYTSLLTIIVQKCGQL